MPTQPLLSRFKQLSVALAFASLAGCASAPPGPEERESVRVGADDPRVEYSGRTEGLGTPKVTLGYSGARVRLRFEGASLGVWMDDETGDNSVMVWIDGEARGKLRLNAEDGYYPLADSLERYPKAKLVVLQGPMNNTEELGAALQEVVGRLNEWHPERTRLFELSPQGEVGLGADYHPNRAQSRINAEELAAYLSELMGWGIGI